MSYLQLLFVCRWLLTGGTVTPASLKAVVPTVLEGYLTVASVSLELPPQFVHCCLITARAFMPASLIAIPYTILEISTFLGQLPVDDDHDHDDENSRLNMSIASLRSELYVLVGLPFRTQSARQAFREPTLGTPLITIQKPCKWESNIEARFSCGTSLLNWI